jgi:hypothetical protein
MLSRHLREMAAIFEGRLAEEAITLGREDVSNVYELLGAFALAAEQMERRVAYFASREIAVSARLGGNVVALRRASQEPPLC